MIELISAMAATIYTRSFTGWGRWYVQKMSVSVRERGWNTRVDTRSDSICCVDFFAPKYSHCIFICGKFSMQLNFAHVIETNASMNLFEQTERHTTLKD